jgi:hypothetical protein
LQSTNFLPHNTNPRTAKQLSFHFRQRLSQRRPTATTALLCPDYKIMKSANKNNNNKPQLPVYDKYERKEKKKKKIGSAEMKMQLS